MVGIGEGNTPHQMVSHSTHSNSDHLHRTQDTQLSAGWEHWPRTIQLLMCFSQKT